LEPLTPYPLVPSATDRERLARVLGSGAVDVRRSRHTLSYHLGLVFGAREAAAPDPPAPLHPRRLGPFRRALLWLVERASTIVAEIERAWERPRLEALPLPADLREDLIIGRSRDAELVLSHPTVSRSHARLHHNGESWVIRDLGSRNGTTVNGLRVVGEAILRPGDIVSLGDATYRLLAPPH